MTDKLTVELTFDEIWELVGLIVMAQRKLNLEGTKIEDIKQKLREVKENALRA